jgi:MFS transporter, NNP family, nitrate/nitrite transporter
MDLAHAYQKHLCFMAPEPAWLPCFSWRLPQFDQFELPLVTAGGLGGMYGLMNIFTRATGGMLSDLAALRWGMRGRLWTLWIIQTLGGLFCMLLGLLDYTFGGTIAAIILFSIFSQQACGAHFGIAPFISRRAYGVVSGTIGAGGNLGAMVTQIAFFAGTPKSPV